MYNMLLWLHESGKLTAELLANAVIKKWINEEEENKILNSKE